MQDFFKKWIVNPYALVVAAVGILFVITDGVEKLGKSRDYIEKIINAGLEKPAGVNVVHLHLWFANVLVVVAVLWILTFVALQRLWQSRKSLQTKEVAHAELVTKTLEGMMAASLAIRNQLISEKDKVALQFSRIEITYVIRANGNAEVSKLFHLKAVSGPVHFWEFPITVDQNANEVEFLDTINFKVKEEGEEKKNVVYLIMRNSGRAKSVVLYFLPAIQVGEAKDRILHIRYEWPGLANSLIQGKRDNWGLTVESAGPVPEVKVKYLYERLGRKVNATVVGSTSGNQELKAIPEDAARLSAWEYIVKNAPSDKYLVELKLQPTAGAGTPTP